MKFLTSLLVVCLLMASPAFAQDPQGPAAAPLTESEKLQLDRAALLQQVESLVKEVAQWRQMFAQAAQRLGEFEVHAQQESNKAYTESVIKDIEAARPGFVFNPKDGSFTPAPPK